MEVVVQINSLEKSLKILIILGIISVIIMFFLFYFSEALILERTFPDGHGWDCRNNFPDATLDDCPRLFLEMIERPPPWMKPQSEYSKGMQEIDRDCAENYLEYNFNSVYECANTKKNNFNPFEEEGKEFAACLEDYQIYMRGIVNDCQEIFGDVDSKSFTECILEGMSDFEEPEGCWDEKF